MSKQNEPQNQIEEDIEETQYLVIQIPSFEGTEFIEKTKECSILIRNFF